MADGPLHSIRHRRGLAVSATWRRTTATCSPANTGSECRSWRLGSGRASSRWRALSTAATCSLGDPGPWAGRWAGSARLEMPSGLGPRL